MSPATKNGEVIGVAIGETFVNVNGRIVTDVERRDLGERGELASFLVISTERRFDKNTGDWVDGRKFSVWVTCWRRLARNVALSLEKGDDVMISGRLRTREFEQDGKMRYSTELDAHAIGPNLTRAVAQIRRIRAADEASVEEAVAA